MTAIDPKKDETPIETTVRVLGGKNKVIILWILMDGTKRFSEIHSVISYTSSRMLSKQLRELEADGLISRKVVQKSPPWVEYSLTTLGMSAIPVVEEMAEWGAAFKDMEREKGLRRSP